MNLTRGTDVVGWPGNAFWLAPLGLGLNPLFLSTEPHNGEVGPVDDPSEGTPRQQGAGGVSNFNSLSTLEHGPYATDADQPNLDFVGNLSAELVLGSA